MTEQETIKAAMTYLGKRTSKAKAEAAKRNGRKGGRPKASSKGRI